MEIFQWLPDNVQECWGCTASGRGNILTRLWWAVSSSLQFFFHLTLNLASTGSIASRRSLLCYLAYHNSSVTLAVYTYYSTTKHAALVDGGYQIPGMLRTMRSIEGRFGHWDSDRYVGVLEMITCGMDAQQAREQRFGLIWIGRVQSEFFEV